MSQVFECFTGEFVSLLLNKDNKNIAPYGHDVRTVQSPMVVQAYLIEEDDEYFLLGHDPDLICIAVNKKQVVLIEIADPLAETMHQLNDAVPTPTDDTGVN